MIVIGARPQIIKSAPVIRRAISESKIDLQVVHTGQHYDYRMSKLFFEEFDLVEPLVNLKVGSGTHGWQTGMMIAKLEKTMIDLEPEAVLVPGDTNSTLAGALAAVKLKIPVAHLEAGARSYDVSMPEEVNRRLTDHCSTILFAPTRNCVRNLLKEGISRERAIMTGDTMYDTFLKHIRRAMDSNILQRLGLHDCDYAFLTIHRPENVDAPRRLESILEALNQLKELSIVFPLHPRTRRNLREMNMMRKLLSMKHLRLIDPVTYHESLKLTARAKVVITDSGGLQKEAYWLKVPCVTLRETTEWMETVTFGSNVLVGNCTELIVAKTREFASTRHRKVRTKHNLFGDGDASSRVISSLRSLI